MTSARRHDAGVLRAVLFDLDDTLVDQDTAAATAVVAWAAEHGIAEAKVGDRWATISDLHYSRYQRRELTFAQQRRARVRDFLKLDIDDDQADKLFAGYLARYEDGWTVFDDAVPALRQARAAGLTVAVLTNGDHDHQRFKLQKLGLTDEVDVLIASSTLPAGKPDPQAFLHAIALTGTSPAETLMVGNSLANDVRGALNAGLQAVLLDRHDAHPTATVPRVRSLSELRFSE